MPRNVKRCRQSRRQMARRTRKQILTLSHCSIDAICTRDPTFALLLRDDTSSPRKLPTRTSAPWFRLELFTLLAQHAVQGLCFTAGCLSVRLSVPAIDICHLGVVGSRYRSIAAGARAAAAGSVTLRDSTETCRVMV